MALTSTHFTFLCVVLLVVLAKPARAFGAGDIASISKIEGQNWRHGDLENALLQLVAAQAMNGGKKFSALDVKRIYFGNWLRDYSQAVDVGTVKHVSAEAIRIVLWILGFMSFGYGSKEFEVTTERLGCYRPEEHIDNPKDYAENEDARQYDRRLRGPVNERKELAIDPETGMKAYIASENLGIATSAGLVRRLYSECIELGRRYARNNNKADKYEALRLLGTANHCLEDFSAHSNYVELALIEMGERDIFPHVGSNCEIELPRARHRKWPIVTGTFGGVDFLHSVCGEFDDKVTQSEIQELEGTLQNAQSQGGDQSALQDLLNQVPSGLFGGKDEAGRADELKQNAMQAQMQHAQVTPREPEEWLRYIQDVQTQIYPIIEWHDEIMQDITETIEKIPVLPDVIEKIQEHVNVYVFSLMAPFLLPIIQRIKSELNVGSGAIIESSEAAQHIVFNDPDSSDPTHSMLSKDHFSNVLNEPAGKVAREVLRWVVPQIVECWDNEDIDVDRTVNRIIRGVLHHPALRNEGEDGASDGRHKMFAVVEQWWSEQSGNSQDGLREQLSRDGVQEGRNHKPGVKDHGHGSGKPLGMPNSAAAGHPGAPGGFGPGSGISNQASQHISQAASAAVGGGALGSLVGGLAGAVGTGILAGVSSAGKEDEEETPQRYGGTSYGGNSSSTETYGRVGGGTESSDYGRSEYGRTDHQYGRSEQSSHYSQNTSGYSSYSRREEHSTYGESDSRRYGNDSTSSYGRQESSGYGNSGYGSQHVSSRRDDDDDERSHHGRRHEQSSYGQEERREHHSSRRDDDYGRQSDSYGGSSGYGRSDRYETESGYSRQETSSYGRSDRDDYRGSGSGRSGGDEYSSGGHRQSRGDEYSSGYGRRGDDSEEMPGGFGGDDDDNRGSSYGRRRRGDDNEYGERQGGYGY